MRRALALVFVVASPLACGAGGAAPPSSPKGADSDRGSANKPVAGAEPAAAEPARKPCADGSCVECGEGVCPGGFYCARARGRSGCAWIAPCAEKPTCACVAAHTKRCACEDKGGVAFVSCS